MTEIKGNTYPVKDQIKALGGKWDADNKCWSVPDNKAEAAKALVAGASVSSPSKPTKRYFARCHECNAPSRGYYRCYECSIDYREGGGMYAGGQSYRTSNGVFVLGDDD